MDSPSTHQYPDETYTMAFRVLAATALFTLTAILWHNNFIGCMYRLLVLFKVGLTALQYRSYERTMHRCHPTSHSSCSSMRTACHE